MGWNVDCNRKYNYKSQFVVSLTTKLKIGIFKVQHTKI